MDQRAMDQTPREDNFSTSRTTPSKFKPGININPALLAPRPVVPLSEDSKSVFTSAATDRSSPKPFVILPLYIYPQPSAWDSLFSVLSSQPDLDFSIIVNPNSGPDGPPGGYPDANYVASVSQLRTYPNAQLLGYVPLDACRRSLESVEADIRTYANWSTHPEADIHVDGIFFDEAPSDSFPGTLTYLSTISDITRTTIPNAHLTINPGVPVPTSPYYTFFHTVVAFEDYQSRLSLDRLEFPFSSIPKPQCAKSAFIIHHFSGSQAALGQLVRAVVDKGGVPGLFVSTQQGYDAWSDLWEKFVGVMAETRVGGKEGNAGAKTGGLRKLIRYLLS